MSELLVITNLPSPYRVHELAAIDDSLAKRGHSLRVHFLAATERGRHWPVDLSEFRPPYRLGGWPTFHASNGLALHTDLLPWVDLRRAKPTWALVGGAWYQPAVFASLMARGEATKAILWCENFRAESHARGPAALLRRAAFFRADGFAVPGRLAEEWCRSFDTKPVLRFPHFVDERLYRDKVECRRAEAAQRRADMGIAEDHVVFLWPARLHPFKGIEPFLQAIRLVGGRYTILLAGEGPLRGALESIVASSPRSDVRLLGHQTAEQLVGLYAVADCLLLPSILDPFPLVTVEALWAALPLLVSTNVGSVPEVLGGCSNGWAVDPSDPDSVAATFMLAIHQGRDGLAQMGQRSRRLAEQHFSSVACADRFVNQLLGTFPPLSA